MDYVKLLSSVLAASPSVGGGKILPGAQCYQVAFSVEAPELGETVSFTKVYNPSMTWESPPIMNGAVIVNAWKSDGARGVFRQKGETKSSMIMQLWTNSDTVEHTVDFTKTHGRVQANAIFGKPEWNKTNTCLAYIAETCPPKLTEFYDEDGAGTKFEHVESFGELMSEVTKPELWLWADGESTKVSVNENVHPARLVWVSDSQIVFVGYEKVQPHFGLMYCNNRPCSLYSFEIKQPDAVTKLDLSSEYISHLKPQHVHGSLISYLGIKPTFAYQQYSDLVLFDLETKEERVLRTELFGLQDQFGWLGDSFVFTDTRGCSDKLCSLSLSTGELTDAEVPFPKPHSVTILDRHTESGKMLVAVNSRLNQGVLLFGRPGEWERTFAVGTELPQLSEFRREQIHVERGDAFLYYSDPTNPLILQVHGGPHVAAADSYLAGAAFFMAAGYNLLAINFTGSGGFGPQFIEDLLTNIGKADITDIWRAVEFSRAKVGISTDRLLALGGSYGGYLTLTLCQDEQILCGAARNAVSNLASMSMVTDINDWTFAEALNTGVSLPVPPEQLKTMYEKSPIAKPIIQPVLLNVGGKDL